MWPDDAQAWYRQYEEDAIIYVRGRLTPYPVLLPFRAQLARRGVEYAQRYSQTFLEPHRDCFDKRRFREWWRVRGYGEALRFVLDPEPCEMILQQLPVDAQRLLLWRYVDQMRDKEVGRVLILQTSNRLFFDEQAAWTRSLEAYQEFCRRLPQHFLPPGGIKASPQVVSSAFPLFPHEPMLE